MALAGATAEKSAAELRSATQLLLGRLQHDQQWQQDWLQALGSDSWQVRALAVALGSQLVPGRRPYAQLLGALESDHAGLRNSVISLLLNWGPSVTGVVVKHYQGASARVRKFLLDGLRQGEPELMIPFLHSIWPESDLNLRVSILETVCAAPGPMVRDFVLRYRDELHDSVLRLAALECVRAHSADWSEDQLLSLIQSVGNDESTHRAQITLAGACQPTLAMTLLLNLMPRIRAARRMREALDSLATQAARSYAVLQRLTQAPADLWSAVDGLGAALPALLAYARFHTLAGELQLWIGPDMDLTVAASVLSQASRIQIISMVSGTPHASVAAMGVRALYPMDRPLALQLAQHRIWQPIDDPDVLLAVVSELSPITLFLWCEQALQQHATLPTQLGQTAIVLPEVDKYQAQTALVRSAQIVQNHADMLTLLRLSFAAGFEQPPAFALLALRSPESAIRAQALMLVASVAGFDIEAVLRTALLDESDQVFRAALAVLTAMPQTFSRPIVEELWQRTQNWQQWAVFRALERIVVDPCELLERGFDSQYPPIVLDTVLMAQRCPANQAADAVAVCLHHTDPAIVARAIDWYRLHKLPLPAMVLRVRVLDLSTIVRLAVWSYIESQGTMSLETDLLQSALERESDPHLFLRISQIAGRQVQ